MQILDDASEWTWSKKDLEKEAKKVGIRFTTVEDLRTYELDKLDKMAPSYFTSN